MSGPLAYLLTWTCYGTWLHGDPRGSVDDLHRGYGVDLVPASPRLQAAEARRLRHAPTSLGAVARAVVTRTIREHCRLRGWTLAAVNVRTNHVHVVVEAPDTPPERVLSELKAWCTRRLREAGCFGPGQRIWTHHGSTRWIWSDVQLRRACRYVLEGQGDELPHFDPQRPLSQQRGNTPGPRRGRSD